MADSEGATPVIIACQNGHLTHLSTLLAHGASVSDRDAHGRTALHHCVENPDTACAELLLKSDPSLLAAPDDEGLTPLHLAVIAANIPLIRFLLKRGASLTCRDHQQHTVAHWATVCGHAGVLDVLLEYDVELSSPDAHQAYPVHYAAQVARPAQVGPSGHADNDELRHSAREGSQEVHGNLRLLRKLLDHGVSPEVRDKDMRTPIIWAASAGNAEACGLLVAAGANPDAADKDGLCALHCAASRGHVVCVRQLVTTCGARVDPTDQNQCTPLFYAITLGHSDCVTTLLQLGARSSHTDNRGRNSAHCAAVKGSRDILESLRVQGVDMWRPTLKGDYPVHEAAQAGHVEIVQYLLDESPAGTNTVNVANKEGRTCLHIAALTNNLRLAKVLLDREADVNAVMKTKGKSYTSYDAAVAKGYKEAADYLLFRGGISAAKLKEVSAVTEENVQEEPVGAGQSNGTQQAAHAHAGEIQAPPVTVVVVTSSPAKEIGKEFLLVGGRELETERSDSLEEVAHFRHCEAPGPSGDVANGGDKNKSVTVAFPQTETQDILAGETEIVPSTETIDVSTPETTNIPATETRDGPTDEARDGPTTDGKNMIHSEIRDTTTSDTSDALTLQTKEIPTAESRDTQFTETRDMPTVEARDMPTVETRDMPTVDARGRPVTETRDMPVTETRVMPVTETRHMPVTETRDMPTVETRDTPVTETRDMPTVETRDMPVTETRDKPVTETRVMLVTEARDTPVTDTRDMPVTETRHMPVTETRDMPVTETRDMPTVETRDMPVTETRHMPVTEARDMPVTETRHMPVTDTRDMPVTETRDMPLTEGTRLAEREREAAGDEEHHLLTSGDNNVTNNWTNQAPRDFHDLDFDECLSKHDTKESQLEDALSNKLKDTSSPQLQDKYHGQHETGMTQAYDTPDEQTARIIVDELTSISTDRYENAKHEKTVDTCSPKEDTTTDSADTATNDMKCSESDDTVTSDRKCSQSKDTIGKNPQLAPRLPMVTAKKEETTKPRDGKGRKVSQRKARVVSDQRPSQTATTDRDVVPTNTATGFDESQSVTKRQQQPWQEEGHKEATTEPQQPNERQDEPRIDHVTVQHLITTRPEGNNENSAQNGAGTGRKRSKEGHGIGDLNNLSDNDNTDANSDLASNVVNMSPSGGTHETKGVRKVCEEKRLDETTTGKEPRSRRPRTSHVILEVQASVQRFESERRSIRALQQVRRAHITNSPAHDLKLFRSLLLVGGSKHHQDTRFKSEEKKSRPSQVPNKLDKGKQLFCNGRNLQRRRSEVEEDIEKDTEDDSADRCPDPLTTPAPPKHRGDTRMRPPFRNKNHRETSKELSPRLVLREWQQEHHMKVQRSLVLAYSHHVSHHALPAIYHSGKQRSSFQSSRTNTSRPSRPSTTKSLWVSRSHSDSPMSTTRTEDLTLGPVSMKNKGLTSGPSGVSQAQLSFIRRASTMMTSYGTSHLHLDPITTQSCEHS